MASAIAGPPPAGALAGAVSSRPAKTTLTTPADHDDDGGEVQPRDEQ